MKSLAKKLAAVASVVLTANAAVASESYLYWMINQDSSASDAIAFNYATISTDNGSTYLSWYTGGEAVGTAVYVSNYADATTLGYGTSRVYSYLGNDTASTFLVELWSGENERLGSQEIAYSTIQSAIFGGTSLSGATPYVITGGFKPVPEPTSGLLMLLGFAGLALRRKSV